MRLIQPDISLKKLNTFGIDVKAKYFASFQTEKELISVLGEVELLIKHDFSKLLFLGSGSNILFTKDFDGVILKNEIAGIQVVHEDDEFVYVTAGAGVIWHDFVEFCIANNFPLLFDDKDFLPFVEHLGLRTVVTYTEVTQKK